MRQSPDDHVKASLRAVLQIFLSIKFFSCGGVVCQLISRAKESDFGENCRFQRTCTLRLHILTKRS